MKQKIERLRSLDIAGALKAVNYKYFGDYPLSEDQWDSVWTMHSAAEALPSLLSHIDALEARVEELQAAINTMAEKVSECAERYTVAERALAEAVEVLRTSQEAMAKHIRYLDCAGVPMDTLRQAEARARAFLTKRGEKSND